MVDIRQLRYVVTLAEELHFGRAAAREHIVQSALSQQIQRLERSLDVVLFERSTHYVRLTAAGESYAADARQILSHVERALAAARAASTTNSMIRVAVGDPSFDSMPQVLRVVRHNHPQLEIHQIEASVPEQYRLLASGRLDVGIGRASHAPGAVASELLRLDPVGVLFADGHRLAQLQAVPVAMLASERLLFAEEDRAPEFNQFITELCHSAGFTPKAYRGTVQSARAAVELVLERRCLLCVPRSCRLLMKGIQWLPLVDPPSHYPWSLLSRAGDETELVRLMLRCGRALSASLRWTAAMDARDTLKTGSESAR
jgi:DNA-binding transcriptional LysR family regulator